MEDYKEQVKASIAKIAAEKPDTRIIIITDGKTTEQIDFIFRCAQEAGLKVIKESHADMEKTLREKLAEHINAEAFLEDLPPAHVISRGLEEAKLPPLYPADDPRHQQRRDQREQMKLRMRFSNRKKK
jgi:hypothetical protein